MSVAVCPGSFDPVTYGHLDVIERAARLVDEVVVAVGTNSTKNTLFTPQERLEMLRESVVELPGVRVEPLSGLLVDFCQRHGASIIVKGLRFAKDFDYELQMAQMNHHLSEIETVMLPTSARWSYVSSTMIREIALSGGVVDGFVPEAVRARLRARSRHTKED